MLLQSLLLQVLPYLPTKSFGEIPQGRWNKDLLYRDVLTNEERMGLYHSGFKLKVNSSHCPPFSAFI